MGDSATFVRAIFAEGLAEGRRDRRFFLIALALLAVPGILSDLLLSDPAAATVGVVLGFATLYLQLALTFRALHRAGATPPDYAPERPTDGRFVSAFMISFLESIVVIVGLLLLVIPGVLLIALWSLALPALAAENLGATDAMRRSWRIVRPAIGRILLALLVFVAAVAVLIAMTIALEFVLPDSKWPFTLAINIGYNALLLLSPLVWVAAYLALRENPA